MAGEGSEANKTGGAFTCFAIKVADLKSAASVLQCMLGIQNYGSHDNIKN